MDTEDEAVQRTPVESALAGAVLAGVVVVVWLMVALALISFAPASAPVAAGALVASVVGWIVSSTLPVPQVFRWVAAGAVVAASIPVGLAIADNTPPRGDSVAEELEAVASPFIDFEVGATSSMPIAPWEAPVATLTGAVRATGRQSPIEVVEAALVDNGFAVTILNIGADGLSDMDESRGPSTDLAASRGRWQLRASLDEARIVTRLRWKPLVTTVDPFRGDGTGSGVLGAMGGFAGGLVFHWVAALIALFAAVFTLASTGGALVVAAGALNRRRDRRSSSGEGGDRGRTDRSASTP